MNQMVPATPRALQLAHGDDIFANPAAFEHAQRVAKVFASSNMIPQHLRGNFSDCLIAYQIARRLGEEPLTVFQNIYVVGGRPGWRTEYIIARANRLGVFKKRITWKASGSGDSLVVTATATLADGNVVEIACDMQMAKAEGWTKNPKYQSMPEHMLRWRSAAMLIRLHVPEVMGGMPISDEIEHPIKNVTPANDALEQFAQPAREAAERRQAMAADPEAGTTIDHDEDGVVVEPDEPEPEIEDEPTLAAVIERLMSFSANIKTPADFRALMDTITGAAGAARPGDSEVLRKWWTSEAMRKLRNRVGVEVSAVPAMTAEIEALAATL